MEYYNKQKTRIQLDIIVKKIPILYLIELHHSQLFIHTGG